MAVEFALVAPVFLLLLFGIIEIGRYMMIAQLVTGASRQGARVAVLSNANVSEIVSEVNSYLAGAAVPADAVTVTITGQTTPDGNADQAINLSTIQQGLAVRVRVQVAYNRVAWVTMGFLDLPNISVATVMRKEAH